MGREVIRYGEAFKLKVVRELESGRLRNISEARQRYGIRGSKTVQGWIRKYGSEHIQRRVVRVETTDERDQIAALKKRIAELERAVVDSKVQEVLHKASFDVVCREYGVSDPEKLKKSIVEKLSAEQPNTRKKKKR